MLLCCSDCLVHVLMNEDKTKRIVIMVKGQTGIFT